MNAEDNVIRHLRVYGSFFSILSTAALAGWVVQWENDPSEVFTTHPITLILIATLGGAMTTFESFGTEQLDGEGWTHREIYETVGVYNEVGRSLIAGLGTAAGCICAGVSEAWTVCAIGATIQSLNQVAYRIFSSIRSDPELGRS